MRWLMQPVLWLVAGVAASAYAAPNCPNYNPERDAYFGDLHVHTSFSLDAIMQDTRTVPADAYRYARGEAIEHPPSGSRNSAAGSRPR